MKKIIASLLPLFIGLSLTAFSCKKADTTPVEPPTHGSIEGTTTSFSDGQPLSMVNVYSIPASSFVKTDDFGRYQITTVAPGEYKVFAAKNGFDTLTVNVTVVAGAIAAGDFILVKSDTNKNKQYGQITGTIFNSKTFAAINNVNLTSIPVTSSITSDASGKYTFVNVPPGRYTLFPEKTGYDTTSLSVNVIAGQITNADIYFTETDTTVPPTTGTIAGTVLDAQTSLPIAQGLVNTTPSTSTVFTNTDGTYSFDNISPGNYSVSVTKTGYQSAATTITVFAGNTTTANFTMLTSTGSIIGIVTDDSTHLPIASVNVQTQPGTASTTTDGLGKYSFGNIAPASYTIKATASGYQDATLTIEVIAGNSTQADISMIATK